MTVRNNNDDFSDMYSSMWSIVEVMTIIRHSTQYSRLTIVSCIRHMSMIHYISSVFTCSMLIYNWLFLFFMILCFLVFFFFFFQAEDGIRDLTVTGVQTCALPI